MKLIPHRLTADLYVLVLGVWWSSVTR